MLEKSLVEIEYHFSHVLVPGAESVSTQYQHTAYSVSANALLKIIYFWFHSMLFIGICVSSCFRSFPPSDMSRRKTLVVGL